MSKIWTGKLSETSNTKLADIYRSALTVQKARGHRVNTLSTRCPLRYKVEAIEELKDADRQVEAIEAEINARCLTIVPGLNPVLVEFDGRIF